MFCLAEQEESWFLLDDARVLPVRREDALRVEAYIAFYRRIEAKNSDDLPALAVDEKEGETRQVAGGQIHIIYHNDFDDDVRHIMYSFNILSFINN